MSAFYRSWVLSPWLKSARTIYTHAHIHTYIHRNPLPPFSLPHDLALTPRQCERTKKEAPWIRLTSQVPTYPTYPRIPDATSALGSRRTRSDHRLPFLVCKQVGTRRPLRGKPSSRPPLISPVTTVNVSDAKPWLTRTLGGANASLVAVGCLCLCLFFSCKSHHHLFISTH